MNLPKFVVREVVYRSDGSGADDYPLCHDDMVFADIYGIYEWGDDGDFEWLGGFKDKSVAINAYNIVQQAVAKTVRRLKDEGLLKEVAE